MPNPILGKANSLSFLTIWVHLVIPKDEVHIIILS
jgi:hypothetical protein